MTLRICDHRTISVLKKTYIYNIVVRKQISLIDW